MAKPRRLSIEERNAAAIAREPGKVDAAEKTGGEESAQPAAPLDAAPVAPTVSADAPTRRSSVYLTEYDLRNARSAYIVDFDHRAGSPGSFGLWAAGAIAELAALDVEQRQAVREDLGEPGPTPHKSQQLLVPDEVATAVTDAMRQDRLAGVVDRSRSVFYSYALRWQSRQSALRAGLQELPDPPERLPRLDLR
ncbi:hypothetical protein ACTXPC_15460 [Brachybacterium alimentarium]|uniref:hypothetical protein n=1 Tax=Brachybacterium alimentarium TaxID=47845 RepID=UPI000DF153FE|nr:hypothetical protein [Brachybacterium alimentarium]RCS80095.1 hypothetical protein CIK70_06575 [Brachybacterium alimentarium]